MNIAGVLTFVQSSALRRQHGGFHLHQLRQGSVRRSGEAPKTSRSSRLGFRKFVHLRLNCSGIEFAAPCRVRVVVTQILEFFPENVQHQCRALFAVCCLRNVNFLSD